MCEQEGTATHYLHFQFTKIDFLLLALPNKFLENKKEKAIKKIVLLTSVYRMLSALDQCCKCVVHEPAQKVLPKAGIR